MHSYLAGPGPIAVAHRGGAAEAPENSRAAVEHTVALGIHYFETDVHATSDGVVVLSHDPTLERVAGTASAVGDLTWEQVAELHDTAGQPLVRLSEQLADYPQLKLNIDAKDDAVVEPLISTLREAGALDRVCIASFDDDRLTRIRRLVGRSVATSLGRRAVIRLVVAARLPGPARALALRGVPGPKDGAVCVQVPVRHRGVPVVTRAFLRAAHAHGLAVHVWTVDDAAEMRRLLDMGVDGIVSDRPSVLVEVLDGRGPWH